MHDRYCGDSLNLCAKTLIISFYRYLTEPDTNQDTMGILIGVLFLFPICRVYGIPFNDNRLYGDLKTVAVWPVFFNEIFKC